MSNLSASFLFSGYSDYWSGIGGRGKEGGAAFAYYGKDTTLRDLVDQWVEDFRTNEYDFEECPESITDEDCREAILESFTALGRADYDNNVTCEFSQEWADANGMYRCEECNEPMGVPHEEDCPNRASDENFVTDEDCPFEEDWGESPVAIMWIEWEKEHGKLVVGEKVMIDNIADSYGYGKIVKITDTSVFIEIDGKKYRRDFDEVYPIAEEDDYNECI